MRISDWSSDVCSSDLLQFDKGAAKVWQFTERCTRALVSVDTTCCAAASAAICSAELRSIFCGDLIAVMYQRVRPGEGVTSSQDCRPVTPPSFNRRHRTLRGESFTSIAWLYPCCWSARTGAGRIG